MQKAIYLDYNATTPVDHRVFEAMRPYFDNHFGNPASQLHTEGAEARKSVERARAQVAHLLNAQPEEIAFTSGATESNNWAIKGIIDSLKEPVHILTSNIEHASVREPLLDLQKRGHAEVDFLPVSSHGFLTVDHLERARKPNTKFLSLIWVHNEIGSIQNLEAIAHWADRHGILIHTDATQAVGKIFVDVKKVPVAMMSFSGHKIYGPKGVGALFIRKGLKLSPLLHGGGQEPLGRSGTLNVPGIAGLGKACEIAGSDWPKDFERMQKLTQNFWHHLKQEFPFVKLNGAELLERSPYSLNITFPKITGSQMLPLLTGICVSGGSACSSGNVHANPVLVALGHDPHDDSVSLRFSAGRMSTQEDFEQAFRIISNSLKTLGFSPSSQGLTSVLE